MILSSSVLDFYMSQDGLDFAVETTSTPKPQCFENKGFFLPHTAFPSRVGWGFCVSVISVLTQGPGFTERPPAYGPHGEWPDGGNDRGHSCSHAMGRAHDRAKPDFGGVREKQSRFW